jgi:hypothetical protein
MTEFSKQEMSPARQYTRIWEFASQYGNAEWSAQIFDM